MTASKPIPEDEDIMTAALRDFPLQLALAILEDFRYNYPTEFQAAIMRIVAQLEKEIA